MQRGVLVPSMVADLSRDWKTLAIRGVIIALFGIAFLVAPVTSLTAFTYLLAGFALVYGILALISGFRSQSNVKLLLLVEGVAGILLGLWAFSRPGSALKAMLWVIAVWAIVSGIMQIGEAIRLRKEIDSEWLLALAGLLSVLFGIYAFTNPGLTWEVMINVLGIYAILFGILIIALGFKVKSAAERLASVAAGIEARAAR